MQLTKTELATYSQFTTNITDRLIDPHILNARKYDVQPYLTADMMTAILALADDATNELATFYTDYVKEVWALSTYIRFMTEHGINITQFGVTKQSDPRGTFNQVGENERATILRMKRSDQCVAIALMTDRLKAVKFTFDSVVYIESKSIDSRVQMISPIKKKRTRPFGFRPNKNFLTE